MESHGCILTASMVFDGKALLRCSKPVDGQFGHSASLRRRFPSLWLRASPRRRAKGPEFAQIFSSLIFVIFHQKPSKLNPNYGKLS